MLIISILVEANYLLMFIGELTWSSLTRTRCLHIGGGYLLFWRGVTRSKRPPWRPHMLFFGGCICESIIYYFLSLDMVNYHFGRHSTLLVLFLEVVTNHSLFYYYLTCLMSWLCMRALLYCFLKIRMYLDNFKPSFIIYFWRELWIYENNYILL